MNHQQMQSDLEAAYHCEIFQLLKAAYDNDFNMQQAGLKKMEYPEAMDWYDTLDEVQRYRVDRWLE